MEKEKKILSELRNIVSQCSTVVRKTVVRATMLP